MQININHPDINRVHWNRVIRHDRNQAARLQPNVRPKLSGQCEGSKLERRVATFAYSSIA